MPGVVVGVDGSEHSRQVLEWAVKEAGLRKASLTVLTVWQVAGNHWTGSPEVYPADAAEAEKMRQAAEEATRKAVDAAGEPGPASVTVRAVSGIAAQELMSAANDADLVVVGSRGGGGFARLMLGSTSNQVVSHATAPVVVIPVGR
jgi:nucleotide-binding universal stress UspA family protein